MRQIEECSFRTADAFCLKRVLPLALVGCLKTNWFLVVMPWLCHNLLSLILSRKVRWWSPNCPIPPVRLKEKGHLPAYLIIFQAIEKAGTPLSHFLVLCYPACQGWALLQELNRGVVRPATCYFPPWGEEQPVLVTLFVSPILLLLRQSLLSLKLFLPLSSTGSKYLSSLKMQSVLACISVGKAASCQTALAHSYLQHFCGFWNLVPQLVITSSNNLYLK